jgi:hypothetical protein
MKKIKLTHKKFAFVDNKDFKFINEWKWYAREINKKWYAVRYERKRGKQKLIYMHRFVLNYSGKLEIDHHDDNGLNNQRYNLRPATHSQNNINKCKPSNNTTGFKGVDFFHKKYFRAIIGVKGKKIYLGLFPSLIDAARAYDEAAKKHHGEFAKLNFS